MKRNLMILMMAVLLLTSCAAASATQAPSPAALPPMADTANQGGAAPSAQEKSQPGAPSAARPAQDRIVIQNADLSLVVKDPQAKMLEIGALAQRLGGFVVSSSMSKVAVNENLMAPRGNITIRVPSKDLDNALVEIKTGAVDVPSENRTGEDVTDRYVDLQSQLKAKQAAADKLYEIMQKTEKAEDTLMVFNQLTQVQSDIEVLKGQINYYDQASTLSAINVTLIAEATIQPIQIAGWQPQGVARDALQALINFFQNFVNFLIWLVILIIPVAAILIFLLALLWRLLRWFWKKVFPRKTPPAVKAE